MAKAIPKQIPLMILGVPFHRVTFEEAVDWVVERIDSGRPANMVTANLDFIMKAWSDPELQRILIEADLVLPDGFPIVKLAPFFGPRLKGRVTGSDITPMLAERAAAEGLSVFGLGASEGVAEKAMQILQARNPGLKVAGTYSPPYAPLLEMDHRAILFKLQRADPDILFVALGAPKQDKFIGMHVRGWQVPVSIGVGGSLDFIAGEQTRAPKWIQRIYLEWFWRMCLNPHRLFSRYIANIHFLFSSSYRMWQIHRMPDHPVRFDPLDGPEFSILQQGPLRVETYQPLGSEEEARRFVQNMVEQSGGQSLLLDIHAVPWLSSLELGALLEVNKQFRSQGRCVILYALRPKVRCLLETCRLTDYFFCASCLKEVQDALALLQHSADGPSVDAGVLRFELPVELSAATLPEMEQDAALLYEEIEQKGSVKALEIHAGQLDFIDSAGLGFLISLKKASMGAGVSMSILGLSQKPRRIFEISRVDKVLLPA